MALIRYLAPALVAVAIFFGLKAGISAMPEIKSFDFKFCSANQVCSRLQARAAKQNRLTDRYALTGIRISSPNHSVIQAEDGYFDPAAKRVILRGVQRQSYSEASFNLESNEIDAF